MISEKTAPCRVQLRRSNTVSVARPGRWGNPFRVTLGIDAAAAVSMFHDRIERDPEFMASLKELRGKNLACWCALDQPCHAGVLLELANKAPP